MLADLWNWGLACIEMLTFFQMYLHPVLCMDGRGNLVRLNGNYSSICSWKLNIEIGEKSKLYGEYAM